MMQAKIRFFQDANTCEEIRRLLVPTNYDLLLQKIRSVNGKYQNFILKYVDDEGDLVVFGTQEEYEIGCGLASQTEIHFLEIHVFLNPKHPKELREEKKKEEKGRIVSQSEIPVRQQAGAAFLHKIIFRNESKNAWPNGCKLSFVRRRSWRCVDSASGSGSGSGSTTTSSSSEDQSYFSTQTWVYANASAPVLPNQQVQVTLPLTSPDKGGHYVEVWRLVDPDGQKFGEKIKIRVVVDDHSTAAVQQEAKTEKIDWTEELSVLSALGFTDSKKNTRLLAHHSGNLEKVVEKLETKKRFCWKKCEGENQIGKIMKEVPRGARHLDLETKLKFLETHKLGKSREHNESVLSAHNGRLRPTIFSLLSASSPSSLLSASSTSSH